MVTVSWTRCKLYDEGLIIMYIRTCTFCVVRHTVMCMYVVSNMEENRDVYGVSSKCDRCC